MRLKKTSNPDFFKIRNLSSEFVTKLPQEAQNELYNEMNRGSLPLGSEPEMSMYMFAYGKMHYEKLLKAFEHLPKTFFDNEIEIIDYGCGQAMGLIAYADYIKQKGYNQKITNITLIEPSKLTIGRAILHANQIFPDVTVNAICKSLDDLQDNDIQTDANTSKLHIFSNIIDVELFSLNQLSDFIKLKFDGTNQFVCVSPYFGSNNSRTNRLDEFMNLIASSKDYSENLGKEDWINGWTCSIRVYAMNKVVFIPNPLYSQETNDLLKSALNGDAENQYQIGLCFANGNGVQKSYQQSVYWYQMSANQGNSKAQNNLGVCYNFGNGVKKDYQEANKFYHLSAEQGNATAQYNLGVGYEFGQGVKKDYQESLKFYHLSAEQGYAAAQYSLGNECKKYNPSILFGKSPTEWYYLSAVQNYASAQKALADCYFDGRWIIKDVNEAIKWYRLSAEQGYVSAQTKLCDCYENGYGVEKNLTEAINWCRLAAKQGDVESYYWLGNYYFNIENDYKQAVKWFRLAAEKGDLIATLKLADCYFYGLGVNIDISEAITLYEYPAKRGLEDAIMKLGKIYYHGDRVEKDYAIAKRWFYKLLLEDDECTWIEGYNSLYSNSVNPELYYYVANAFQNGYGFSKDILIAREWYEKAIDLGCEKSKEMLEYLVDNYFSKIKVPNYSIDNNGRCVVKSGLQLLLQDSFRYEDTIVEIILPNTVELIEDNAFFSFKNLKTITIPSSVITIGVNVFDGCVNLHEIIVDIANPVYESIEGALFKKNPREILYYPPRNETFYEIPLFTEIIGINVFNIEIYCNNFGERISSLKTIKIPNTVKIIGDSSFQNCTGLRSLVIPKSVTSIGENAFTDCRNLKIIHLPESISHISLRAFRECVNLSEIRLPKLLDRIEESTFCGCKSLSEIELPNSLKFIGSMAFAFCLNLKSIIIPEHVEEIQDQVFVDCDSLESINLPSSLKHIGSSIFDDCPKLKTIYIQKGNRFLEHKLKEFGYSKLICYDDSLPELFTPEIIEVEFNPNNLIHKHYADLIKSKSTEWLSAF